MKASVRDLSQHGVVSDIVPYELPSNAWTSGKNISFEDGGVKKIQGMVKMMVPAEANPMDIYTKDNMVYYTTPEAVYMIDGGANHLLNEEGTLYPYTTEWSITELSNVLVFGNEACPPKYKPLNDAILKDLPAWPENWRCSNIKAFGNYLICLGTQEMGVDFPQRIRWSDVTMPNEPPGDWDDTSTTNSAGFNDLSDTKGRIIDGLSLGNAMLIYTEDEVHQMDLINGALIFRFRKILDNVNILSKGCVANVDGKHFVVTRNDVIIHNGNTHQSVISSKIKKQLFDEIRESDSYEDVVVQSYPAKNEVWILYKTKGNTGLNRAAILNTLNLTWAFRDLPNATAVCYGIAPKSNEGVIDSWDVIIDEEDSLINDIGKDFTKAGLFISTVENEWYAIDEGEEDPDRQNFQAYIERVHLDLDDLGLETDCHKQVKAVLPQVTGRGVLNVYLGTSRTPYETPTWTKPVRFNIEKDYKADFRITGRYLSIRFESLDDSEWKLLSYGLDVAKRGGR